MEYTPDYRFQSNYKNEVIMYATCSLQLPVLGSQMVDVSTFDNGVRTARMSGDIITFVCRPGIRQIKYHSDRVRPRARASIHQQEHEEKHHPNRKIGRNVGRE